MRLLRLPGFRKRGAVLRMYFNMNAIEVSNVAKCFNIWSKPHHRLFHALSKGKVALHKEFWALRDINFVVPRGQTVGVVGKNGSGKSTLLQIITGTLDPSHGEVTVNGRVAALLELGAGFNPEFTGMENVYMNASLLGLSREETDARIDDILAFADIGDFVHAPTRTYSSGMLIRLAFAVQAQIEPEVLIVDEALAVGDAKFQAKCFARLKKLKENGTSILLVTHATEQIVSHCDSAILLDGGHMVATGLPRQVVNRYLDILFGKPVVEVKTDVVTQLEAVPKAVPIISSNHTALADLDKSFEARPYYNPSEYRWGDRAAELVDFAAFVNGSQFPNTLISGQYITLALRVRFLAVVVRPIFGFAVKTKEGITIYNTNTEQQGSEVLDIAQPGMDGIFSVSLPLRLFEGDYFVSVGIASRSLSGEVIPHDRRYDSIHLKVDPVTAFSGLVDLQAQIVFDSPSNNLLQAS